MARLAADPVTPAAGLAGQVGSGMSIKLTSICTATGTTHRRATYVNIVDIGGHLRLVILALTLASTATASFGAQLTTGPSSPTAAAVLREAIDAQGGEPALLGVRAVHLDTMSHEYMLEQSERPEGPWYVRYVQTSELRSSALRRLRRQTQRRDWNSPTWSPATPLVQVIDDRTSAYAVGATWRPGFGADVDQVADTFELSPERLLLTARAAKDVRLGSAAIVQGVSQQVIHFTWRGCPATLYLNDWTKRPTRLTIVRDDENGIWGDVTESRTFGWWDVQKGVWYPRQTTIDWNGRPLRDTSVLKLTINPEIKDEDFEVPPETRALFDKVRNQPAGLTGSVFDPSRAVDLGEGIVLLPGSWNVMLVKQNDGVVILDGPISSAYSSAVIKFAQTRFPGSKIKAVVSTSDAWPHIGGLREYASWSVPLYVLDLNRPLVDRLLQATRTFSADRLSQTTKRPVVTSIASARVLGSGTNELRLLPVRGEHGERMLIVYLPGRNLLYTSDLVQRARTGGFFMPAILVEVKEALVRHGVSMPATVVGMHLGPTEWKEVESAIAAAGKNQ